MRVIELVTELLNNMTDIHDECEIQLSDGTRVQIEGICWDSKGVMVVLPKKDLVIDNGV
jgi:hypothetical protein